MSSLWESETKRMQQELNDPLLRVEYNDMTGQYEILKWIPRIRYQDAPGFLFGLEQETVRLGVESGYYSVQMAFDQWDGRAYKAMREGRWDSRKVENLEQELKENREYVDKKEKEEHGLLVRDTIFECHKRMRPTFYSYDKKAGG